MDQLSIPKKVTDFFVKYRFAVLIGALGILLMLIPTGKKEPIKQDTPLNPTEPAGDFRSDLEQILGKIQGAGKVEVLLSIAKGESTAYQSNTSGGDNGTGRVDTVIVTGADRAQNGLVQYVVPPQYLGAIVVCQGADSPTVRLAITQAVCSITGLGADKITVLKMK